MKKIVFILFLLLIFFAGPVRANNLNLSTAAIASQDTSADTVTLQFNVSWDNSWSDSINKDAVWIFLKYSTDSGTTWSHATMKTAGTNPSGFSQGSGTAVNLIVSQDKKGCFIERSSQGSGSVSTTSIKIVWDYAANGLSDSAATADGVIFKIFGIEMVYIPTGSFYLGDGDSTVGQFMADLTTLIPGAVNSESDVMEFNASYYIYASTWYYLTDTGSSDDAVSGASFIVSGSFPKGYAAFYLMKYEITEGQWVEFFNTLLSAQKTTRDITAASGKNSDSTVSRNTISWSSGDATTTRANRSVSYLSWMDLCAFLDWAALRPMTELEYEKACRGPIYPVNGEYSWGTTAITAAKTISGSEDGTETITTSGAEVCYNNQTFTGAGSDVSSGPLRAGIFATSTSTTRLASGGSYYGVMDLAGNLWERTVTVGNATGRGYSGTHGDGTLTTLSSFEGNATNLDWPGISSTNSQGVTGATGAGFRGGAWNTTTVTDLEISNRHFAGDDDSTRRNDSGGRGIRSANA